MDLLETTLMYGPPLSCFRETDSNNQESSKLFFPFDFSLQQDIIVLFSETLQRALGLGLLTQDMVDSCDPALMFTIPRLAIVCGLLILPDGPLNLQRQLSELFRPFRNLLCKIRDLLWTLTSQELQLLEKALCSTDPSAQQPPVPAGSPSTYPACKSEEYITKFHQDYPTTQRYFCSFKLAIGSSCLSLVITLAI